MNKQLINKATQMLSDAGFQNTDYVISLRDHNMPEFIGMTIILSREAQDRMWGNLDLKVDLLKMGFKIPD